MPSHMRTRSPASRCCAVRAGARAPSDSFVLLRSCASPTSATRRHRRLPPPPPRELLLLFWPRALDERCDLPLEYPEKASEPPLLRCCLAACALLPSPYPRASALPVLPELCALDCAACARCCDDSGRFSCRFC